jgi:hypothetical protein
MRPNGSLVFDFRLYYSVLLFYFFVLNEFGFATLAKRKIMGGLLWTLAE